MPHLPSCLTLRAVGAAASVTTVVGATLVAGVLAASASAATAFTPDDVVVYRVGTGAAALNSSATATFLDEFSPTGAAVQSVALPIAGSGINKALTNSGSATSEGLLTLSPDGRFLTVAGYNATPGTASVAGTTSAAVSRTVGIVGAGGTVDTSTSVSDAFSANNVRSAVTADGSAVWITGANSGVRYATKGAGTSAQVSDTAATTNLRNVVVAGGQLHVTSQSGSTRVASVGTGTPTTGPQPLNLLPGAINSTGTPNNNPFQISLLTLGTGTAPDTAYVADQTAAAIQKYSLSNGSWNLTGSVAGLTGVTGVAANVYGGTVRLYATTPSGLFRFTDSSGRGGTLSGTPGAAIATPATNTAFRGVAFAPGTTLTGGTTTPTVGPPTVTTAQGALGAAQNDPTNAGLGVTVAVGANATYAASDLTVTATSSNTSVAPAGGITVGGAGASRTVTVTPGAVGTSTITLTVTAPDGRTGTAAFTYGVSADGGDVSDRYLAGAGNASAAVDVGGGYMLVGDDESDVLRLYSRTNSGLPVKTFDFTGQLPFGNDEVDIEGAARAGDTVYWMGSMSTNSSGKVAPARSTLFATTVSGSGADTTLTYAGANTTLQSDLVAWDRGNGHGLGADHFGFDTSVNGGIANHATNSLNLEGLEFAKGSTSTAYLAFRAPIVPASDRTRALLVPVTNFTALAGANPTAVHGSFGAPIQWDLGGLGVRDLRRNAAGTFVVLAGTADASNATSTLYTWNGDPASPPLTGQSLPAMPTTPGAWEAVVAVPTDLAPGSSLQLIQDNGETVWYGNGQTSKSGLAAGLQKDLTRTVGYGAPARIVTRTALTSSPNPSTAGRQVTFTASVTAPTGTPSGTVAFSDGTTVINGCDARPVDTAGVATCAVTYPAAGDHGVTATYGGTDVYAPSASDPVTQTVTAVATTTTLAVSTTRVTTGDPVTLTATVTGDAGTPDGRVRFTAAGGTIDGCDAVALDANGVGTCTTSFAQPGDRDVSATFADTGTFAASTSNTVTVSVAAPDVATTTTLSASSSTVAIGESVTYTASVTSGSGMPTGTVAFTEAGAPVDGCDAAALDANATATCTVAYDHAGTHRVVASYSGAAGFVASASEAVSVTVGRTAVTVTAHDQTVTFGAVDPTFTVTAAPSVRFITAPTCDVAEPHTAVGTYPIVCSGGDAGDDYAIGYVDGTLTVAKAATSVTVLADPVSPTAAQAVRFTATVSTGGIGTATGTVAFSVRGSALAGCDAVTVDGSGEAACTVPGGFLPGDVTVDAGYSGDGSHEAGAGAVTTTVARAASSTRLSVAPASPVAGQQVVLTASVSGPSGITPTGTVAFTVDGAVPDGCDAVALDGSSRATCTLPAGGSAGTHRVVATYSGDDDLTGGDDRADLVVKTAASDTTVTRDVNAPVNGQSLTFTAKVAVRAPGAATPTGTVAFTAADGSTLSDCGAVAVDATGAARCAVPAGYAPGSYRVTARYSGDGNVDASAGSVSFTVGKGAVTVALSASPNPPTDSSTTTFRAVVSATSPASGTPTGSVAFTVTSGPGNTRVACSGGGTVALSGGVATCVVPAGSLSVVDGYTATARYLGTAGFNAGSGSVVQAATVVDTTTKVTSSANPSPTGAGVSLRATVTPQAGKAKPAGSVTFTVVDANGTPVACAGSNTIGMSNGVATCVIGAGVLRAANGPYQVQAMYSGKNNHRPSAGSFTQTMRKATSKVTVTQSSTSSETGVPVTFTAKVTAASVGPVAPGGTISFRVTDAKGAPVSCAGGGQLSADGTSTCTVAGSLLVAEKGPYQVVALYSGDVDYAAAKSATVSHTVTRPAA